MRRILLLLLCFVLAQVALAQPTTSAPAPPDRSPADVISIYGEAYNTLENINYDPNWGQSGHMQVNPAFDPGDGNLVLAYPNFNYQGTEIPVQNASAMEFLHVDIWTSNATVVQVSPIDNSGSGPAEVLADITFTAGQWSSVDLPKDAFTNGDGTMSWESIFQLKFDGQAGTTPADIYLDNIYFWKTPTSSGTDATLSSIEIDGEPLPGFTPSALTYTFGVPGGTTAVPQVTSAEATDENATVNSITQATEVPGNAVVSVTAADGTTTAEYIISFFFTSPTVAAPDPGNSPAEVISLFSDAFDDVAVDTWNTSWSESGFEDTLIDGNPTKHYFSMGFNGIETTTSPLDVTSMSFLNLTVWTPNMTSVRVEMVDWLGDGFEGGNGDTKADTIVPLTQNEWNLINIPLSYFMDKGMTSMTDINQFVLRSEPFGSGIMFLDNMFFSTVVNSLDGTVTRADVVLSPNPVAAGATIELPAAVRSAEVYDLTGRLVANQRAGTLSTAKLSQGLYLVRMRTDQGVLTQRLIVQ